MNFQMPWTTKAPTNSWSAPIEDVKQQIGQHVEHLAEVAAQVGRDVAQQAAQVSRDVAQQAAHVTQDAGSQAATVARDLTGQAVKATQSAGVQTVAAARDVPAGASSLAQQALRGASQLGRELRMLRVTREPASQPRGPDVMPGIALLAGVGGGLALMYFWDPEQGRRRRALFRDQLNKWTRIGQKTASGKAADLRNRTVGLAHEARKAVSNVGGSSEASEASDAESDELSTQSRSSSYTNGSAGNGSQASPIEEGSGQPMTSEVV
jgi:hypothetical protein